MNDDDKFWLRFLGVIFSIAVGFAILITTQTNEIRDFDANVDKLNARLSVEGFSVKEVELNSPVVFVLYETVEDFVLQARVEGVDSLFFESHGSSGYLMFFDEGFAVGHRLRVDSGLVERFLEEK
jgi:hypothetical protein